MKCIAKCLVLAGEVICKHIFENDVGQAITVNAMDYIFRPQLDDMVLKGDLQRVRSRDHIILSDLVVLSDLTVLSDLLKLMLRILILYIGALTPKARFHIIFYEFCSVLFSHLQ